MPIPYGNRHADAMIRESPAGFAVCTAGCVVSGLLGRILGEVSRRRAERRAT